MFTCEPLRRVVRHRHPAGILEGKHSLNDILLEAAVGLEVITNRKRYAALRKEHHHVRLPENRTRRADGVPTASVGGASGATGAATGTADGVHARRGEGGVRRAGQAAGRRAARRRTSWRA